LQQLEQDGLGVLHSTNGNLKLITYA